MLWQNYYYKNNIVAVALAPFLPALPSSCVQATILSGTPLRIICVISCLFITMPNAFVATLILPHQIFTLNLTPIYLWNPSLHSIQLTSARAMMVASMRPFFDTNAFTFSSIASNLLSLSLTLSLYSAPRAPAWCLCERTSRPSPWSAWPSGGARFRGPSGSRKIVPWFSLTQSSVRRYQHNYILHLVSMLWNCHPYIL